MSARQWDDENAVPHIPAAVVAAAQKAKFDGEDEDDDVKDSWEDFDDDPVSEGSKEVEVKGEEVPSATVKKKKSLKEKIAEKEEQVQREREEKRQNSENQAKLTPQQTLEERERHRRLQEEYELELVKKEFGGGKDTDDCGIESMLPSNKEEFEAFKKKLISTISKHEKSSHYIQFVDELFRELCLNMESEDVKKLGNTLTVLANEKNKAAKALQVKGKKKMKGKATLVVGRANDYGDYGEYDGGAGNEYDDFM